MAKAIEYSCVSNHANKAVAQLPPKRQVIAFAK